MPRERFQPARKYENILRKVVDLSATIRICGTLAVCGVMRDSGERGGGNRQVLLEKARKAESEGGWRGGSREPASPLAPSWSQDGLSFPEHICVEQFLIHTSWLTQLENIFIM